MKKETAFTLAAAAAGIICFSGLSSDKVFAETCGEYDYAITDKDQKTCKITAYNGESESVTVPGMLDGYKVTEIGIRAFYDNEILDLTLPDSVEKIGKNAFSGCHDLTSIKLPSNLRKIGDYAFSGCPDLISIQLPSDLKKIGNEAFRNCKFTEITIPQSVESIGENAFPSSVESIIVDGNNKHFDSRENCNAIIERGTNTLIYACEKTIIPDTVTSIGEGAFSRMEDLKEITIPSSIKKIGKRAFYGCDNLEKIDLPEGLTYIGIEAFADCRSLVEIKLPDSVETLKKECFRECSMLESINIPAKLKKTDLVSVFGSCKSIKDISVSESNAFYDGRDGCNAVIEKSTDTLVFAGNNSTIPASVKKIGKEAFKYREGIKEITIPDGVKEIGEDAFSGCTNLKKVTLPSSLKVIEEGAFSVCSIKKITIPEGVTAIKDQAFESCGLEKVKLPDSLKTIGQSAFAYCNLKEIRIPKNLKNAVWAGVFSGAFENCGLKKISVDPRNPYFDSRNNCNAVIEKKTGKLVLACNKTTIPSSVKEIGDFAFYGISGISNIKIPNGVKVIGTETFSDCKDLQKITLPRSIKRMGRAPFANENLKSINYKGSKADWKKIKFEEPANSKNNLVRFNSKG